MCLTQAGSRRRLRVNGRFVGRRQHGRHFGARDCLSQERGGRSGVACGADVDVDDLAVLVDRAKRVTPAASNAEIRLVTTPPVAHTTATRARRFLIERSELLDPVEDGGRIDVNATFGEQLREIGIRQAEA